MRRAAWLLFAVSLWSSPASAEEQPPLKAADDGGTANSLDQAKALARGGEFEQALALYQRLIQKGGLAAAQAQKALAALLTEIELFDEAQVMYAAALEGYLRLAQVQEALPFWEECLRLAMKLGRYEEALAYLKNAHQLAPAGDQQRRSQHCVQEIICLERLGRHEALLEACGRALRQSPPEDKERQAWIYVTCGDALLQLGRFEEAAAKYQEAGTLVGRGPRQEEIGLRLKRVRILRSVLPQAARMVGVEIRRLPEAAAEPSWLSPPLRVEISITGKDGKCARRVFSGPDIPAALVRDLAGRFAPFPPAPEGEGQTEAADWRHSPIGAFVYSAPGKGLKVLHVSARSPAAEAGLEKGACLTRIGPFALTLGDAEALGTYHKVLSEAARATAEESRRVTLTYESADGQHTGVVSVAVGRRSFRLPDEVLLLPLLLPEAEK